MALPTGCRGEREWQQAQSDCKLVSGKSAQATCLLDRLHGSPLLRAAPNADLYVLFLTQARNAFKAAEAGQITSDDADARVAQMRVVLNDSIRQRSASSAASEAASMAAFGAALQGLGAYNQSVAPRALGPSPSGPTTYTFPGRAPITCSQIGQFVNCN